MIFTWSFWAFHDILGVGKYGFSCSVYPYSLKEDKNSWFVLLVQENPLGFFCQCFLKCYQCSLFVIGIIHYYWLYESKLLFYALLLGVHWSPDVLYCSCCCWPRVLRIWLSIFYLRRFSPCTLSLHLVHVPP